MAVTMQNIVDLARIALNDDDKDRHPDASLLSRANACLNDLRCQRPDLFVGQYLASTDDLALGDTFPLEKSMVSAVADYVTAYAEAIDDEHVNSGRSSLFLQLFGARL